MNKLQSTTLEPLDIKINVDNIDAFLTESISIYYQLFINNVKQILHLEQKVKEAVGLRKTAIKNILKATEHNALLIKDIVDSLMPYIKTEHILQYKYQQNNARGANNFDTYFKDFKYLRRDWAGTVEGENQIEKIIKAIKPAIKEHSEFKEKALFLGAGLGRIALEHTDVFEKVYALDKSYSMAYHFQKLLKNNIDFYEINPINVMRVSDCTKQHTSSLRNGSKSLDVSKFEYIVGDVMQLPFEDNSLSCIVSAYFTDVIALKLYFKEIKRTLKPNGLFIHFGPLDYFFSDILHTLSCEEIEVVFKENNFKNLINQTIDTFHLKRSLILSNSVRSNWFFVTKKSFSKIDTQIK